MLHERNNQTLICLVMKILEVKYHNLFPFIFPFNPFFYYFILLYIYIYVKHFYLFFVIFFELISIFKYFLFCQIKTPKKSKIIIKNLIKNTLNYLTKIHFFFSLDSLLKSILIYVIMKSGEL